MLPITKQIKQINCYASQNHPKYIVIHETDNFNKGAGAASTPGRIIMAIWLHRSIITLMMRRSIRHSTTRTEHGL